MDRVPEESKAPLESALISKTYLAKKIGERIKGCKSAHYINNGKE